MRSVLLIYFTFSKVVLYEEIEFEYMICLYVTRLPRKCGIIIFFFNLRTAAFKAYCVIWVRRSNFRHHARATSGGRWNCGREMSGNFADLHVTFRDLLHAVKLRHSTDGFTSPPKEGVQGIFSP